MGKVLTFNAGSSSIKWAFYDPKKDALLIKGRIERLGTSEATSFVKRFFTSKMGIGETVDEQPTKIRNSEQALPFILDTLSKEGFIKSAKDIAGVGHRVVHGGEIYKEGAIITAEVVEDIGKLAKFAPLHQPHNLGGIKACEKLLPEAENVAIFDTAFHQTMKPSAFLYGLSPKIYKKYGIRKYGFHGTNHKYCMLETEKILGKLPRRLITCHLGNGSSITAIRKGKSVDTSMGFTPTDGLVMGTRSGAIDPEAVLYLLREWHQKPEKLEEFLNHDSGLKAIAGTEDMRDIWTSIKKGNQKAKIAFEMLCYQVAKYIGSYAAALNGLDCLVFTGGMGEKAWYVRAEICYRLGHLGILLDTEKNQGHAENIARGKIPILIIPANEELQIARETAEMLGL